MVTSSADEQPESSDADSRARKEVCLKDVIKCSFFIGGSALKVTELFNSELHKIILSKSRSKARIRKSRFGLDIGMLIGMVTDTKIMIYTQTSNTLLSVAVCFFRVY